MAQGASFSYRKNAQMDSHIERVASSLRLLSSSKNLTKRELLIRKGIASVIIFVLVSYGLSPLFIKAETAVFYPSACLGGWTNLHNAEGEPESLKDKTIGLGNSAVLPGNTIADLYCGSFQGTIPQDAIPKSVKLTFVWSYEDQPTTSENSGVYDSSTSTIISTDLASSTDEIMNASSSTSIQFLEAATTTESEKILEPTSTTPSPETSSEEIKTETPANGEVPVTPTEVPVEPTPTESAPQSFLPFGNFLSHFSLVDRAFAQEEEPVLASPEVTNQETVESPLVETESTTTNTEEVLGVSTSTETATTSEADATTTVVDNATTSLSEPANNPIFEIFYTIDGNNWKSLGTVSQDKLNEATFDIPLVSDNNDVWNSIAALQINVRRLQTMNEVKPILLDGVFVSVEHNGVTKEKEESRSDVKNLLVNNVKSGSDTVVTTKTDSDQGVIIQVKGKSEENLVVYSTITGEMVLNIPLSEDVTEFTSYQFSTTGSYVGVITKRKDACYLMDLNACTSDKNTVDTISFDIMPSTDTPLEFRPHQTVPVSSQ